MEYFAIIIAIISGGLTSVIILLYLRQQCIRRKNDKASLEVIAEQNKMITLINNITDAIFNTDEKGIITAYNSAALSLIDTNKNITGTPISELLLLETVDRVKIDLHKELTKSSAIRRRDDLIMMIDDEDRLRLEVTFAPVQSGDSITPNGYVLIVRDITKIKSLEEERDEFISVVSHELRTPITIAEGSLSNALILAERGAKERVIEALEGSHQQVIFLAKMINDLSTLSRAERGVADATEIINVAELASQLHNEYSPQAAEKGLSFNLDASVTSETVKVSRLYLQELLQNFLTNAIKYTEKGSITLIVKKDKANEFVTFKVKDTGIGIGKSDQQKIFDRFYRAEDYRTRETSGTGLGLYVSAKLARKLGCKIELTSRLNHGSTFSFSLPLHKK